MNEEELEYTDMDILVGMVQQSNLPAPLRKNPKLADAILGEEELDWNALFPVVIEEELSEQQTQPNSSAPPSSYHMPPRMAAAIFRECIILVDVVRICGPKGGGYSGEPLPKILRKYFNGKHNKKQRILFLGCFDRILMRLAKGIFPHPNCLGEVVAMALIVQSVQENIAFDRHEFSSLATTPYDEDFDLLKSYLFDTDDIIALQIILGDAKNTALDEESSYSWMDCSELSSELSLSANSLFPNEESSTELGEEGEGEQQYQQYISQLQTCLNSKAIHSYLKQEKDWIENNIHTYWRMSPDDENELSIHRLPPSRNEMIVFSHALLLDHLSKSGNNAARDIMSNGNGESSNKLSNLHPGRWSVAFCFEEFFNHL